MQRYEEIDREVVRGFIALGILILSLLVADVISHVIGIIIAIVGIFGISRTFWRLRK